MAVTFTNNKVSDAISEDQKYQSKINSPGIITTEQIAQETAENLKGNAAYTESVLKEATKVTKSHLKTGERVVYDGLCRFELFGNGSFETEDESWDPTKHKIVTRIIPTDEVKNAASDIVPVNTLSKVSIQLLGSQDATTYEQNSLVVGHTLLVQGKNVQITTSNADEGLYLVKGDNEYKATITDNTAGTIDATFGDDLTAGEGYSLVIRGRAGCGVNRTLVSAEIKNFTVIAAA